MSHGLGKLALLLLLAGLALLGAWFFIGRQSADDGGFPAATRGADSDVSARLRDSTRDDQDRPAAAPATATVPPRKTMQNAGEPGSIVPAAELARSFRDARSAEEAFEAAELAFRQGDEELGVYLEEQLASACPSNAASFEPPHEKTRWAFEKLEAFCAGFTTDMIARALAHYDAGGAAPFDLEKERLVDALSAADRGFESEALAEFAALADTPAGIDAASVTVLRWAETYGDFRPELGQDPDVPDHQLSAIMEAAFPLYECRVFGGCGPGGVTVLERCMTHGVCEPGWDMETFYMSNISPYQYEQASKVVDFLATLRRRLQP